MTMKGHRAIMWILTCCLASVTSGCEKETTWVYYDETGCADPWGSSNMEEHQKIEAILDFADQQGVDFCELFLVADGETEPCDACHCRTGNRLHGRIPSEQLHKIFGFGFYQ